MSARRPAHVTPCTSRTTFSASTHTLLRCIIAPVTLQHAFVFQLHLFVHKATTERKALCTCPKCGDRLCTCEHAHIRHLGCSPNQPVAVWVLESSHQLNLLLALLTFLRITFQSRKRGETEVALTDIAADNIPVEKATHRELFCLETCKSWKVIQQKITSMTAPVHQRWSGYLPFLVDSNSILYLNITALSISPPVLRLTTYTFLQHHFHLQGTVASEVVIQKLTQLFSY